MSRFGPSWVLRPVAVEAIPPDGARTVISHPFPQDAPP
jgi:hypothetical protein